MPALQALLDYDGKGVLTEWQSGQRHYIDEIRWEAAKAILKHHCRGNNNRADVVRVLLDDPKTHPKLRAAAEVLQKQLAAK